jgi:hypothetical protein
MTEQEDLAQLAAAAATQVTADLLRLGFDEAIAEGPNVKARRGRTVIHLINEIHPTPGNKHRVQDLVAQEIATHLTTRTPTVRGS